MRFGNTTVSGLKTKTECGPPMRSPKFGERLTAEGLRPITPWPEQSSLGCWFVSLARNAESPSPLPTMKTMTENWMLCGCANHAMSSGING
jgi:hypothetical protein